MLTRLVQHICGVAAAAATVALVAAPAAGQFDPTPIDCNEEPTAVECQDDGTPPGDSEPRESGDRTCAHNGTEVPCTTSYGFWVGDVVDGDWYGIHGDVWPVTLVGCWASPTATDRDPAGNYTGPETDGTWYTLSCLGPDGTYPDPGPTQFNLAWTPDTVGGGPDPEELARRALASIDLRPPKVVLSPPETGSVPLGMPVWLAVAESDQTWGPISSGRYCDQGLCVQVTAVVQQVDWRLGDGTELRCVRDQNLAWRPGLNFLAPSGCHHYYTVPSRGHTGGTFAVRATTTWRAEWSGGGRSGVFVGVDDACGPGGGGACQATTSVRVDEIQVLVTR